MRVTIAAAITLWLTPVFAAAVHAFGATLVPSVLIALGIAAAVSGATATKVAETIGPALRNRAIAAVVLALAAAAIFQIARISIYMADPSRTDCSYMAADPWRSRHSCMTAYFEALRLGGADAATNIYDMSLYEPRTIGPLKVDSFHYPPPFLLLPAVVKALQGDIFQFRAVWFALQATILAVVVFGLARWVGGAPGAYLAAGGVAMMASPQVLYSLQQGNIQATAVPVGAAALVLLCAGRIAAGAAMLAYVAAAKIFPGILVVYLAAARRWKAVAATAAGGAAIVLLTFAVFGARPFEDFLRHELPRISSGAAFPQSELPIGTSVNMSVYGLTVRARVLGLEFLDQRRGLAVASVYGILVIALAGLVGWRHRLNLSQPGDRLRLVQVAIALLLLGSFRSPFVGFYGLMAAVWLMTALAAEARSTRSLLLVWLATAAFAVAHTLVPSPSRPATSLHVVLSAFLVCTALAAGLVPLVRVWREAGRATPALAVREAATS
jgi:alpha-1,2-mannosyltransferase